MAADESCAFTRLLGYCDRATKWIVSCVVALVALSHTSPTEITVPIYVLGAIGTAACGKTIKKTLGHKRPNTARKSDFGMPSTHALSVAYLGVAACIGMYYAREDASGMSLLGLLKFVVSDPRAVAALLWSACTAALRFKMGHHTAAQVTVGFLFGASMSLALASVDFWVSDGRGVSAVMGASEKAALLVVFVVVSIGFAVYCAIHWTREDD